MLDQLPAPEKETSFCHVALHLYVNKSGTGAENQALSCKPALPPIKKREYMVVNGAKVHYNLNVNYFRRWNLRLTQCIHSKGGAELWKSH